MKWTARRAAADIECYPRKTLGLYREWPGAQAHGSSLSATSPGTFDRGVRTKPLAFAADAGHPLCILNRGQAAQGGA